MPISNLIGNSKHHLKAELGLKKKTPQKSIDEAIELLLQNNFTIKKDDKEKTCIMKYGNNFAIFREVKTKDGRKQYEDLDEALKDFHQ